MPVTLRAPHPADAEPCGRIIYEAFRDIACRHGFPPDFESAEFAIRVAAMLIGNPENFGVVAELDGRIVGSNFLFEGNAIPGVGPITIDPAAQGSGIGRKLMEAVIERGRQAAGIRLVQDAFNSRSLSLYSSLNFDVKEPLVLIQGRPKSAGVSEPARTIRPMEAPDVAGCIGLCRRAHGFDRASELRWGPPTEPWVLVRDGRIAAYTTAPHFWVLHHAVAETEEDMQALLLGFAAARPQPLSFLLPVRQANLFRWCLAEGFQLIKPMNLMARGQYQEPAGICWLPSVMY